MAKSDDANRPIHTVRYGGIKAAIWKNPTRNGGVMYNVTPVRIYKNDSDAWAESTSFGLDDLLLLSKVAEDCFSFIQEQIQKEAAAKQQARQDQAA
ncbi:MAG TPA: hypothetical protein VG722_01565 [Tepidisphaeraceae bacterium]|nr:hypothetical protein [Tepidisphaeraceae bacterium]